MNVRSDHRSKFSNLSNWKEEAWKKFTAKSTPHVRSKIFLKISKCNTLLLTVTALGKRLDAFFSRPFSLCSSKATISRRSLNCSCLSKNILSCYRIKPAPAPSFGGLSFSPPACKSGSRMRLTLELSSFRPLALEGTIGVPNAGVDDSVTERSSFKLSVRDGLLFVDVLLTLSVAVGLFALEFEDDGCDWDWVARGVLLEGNLVGLPFASLNVRVSFSLLLLFWFGVFLAIFEDQLAEKSADYSLTKNCLRNGAQSLNA